jgi:hypothetical protein
MLGYDFFNLRFPGKRLYTECFWIIFMIAPYISYYLLNKDMINLIPSMESFSLSGRTSIFHYSNIKYLLSWLPRSPEPLLVLCHCCYSLCFSSVYFPLKLMVFSFSPVELSYVLVFHGKQRLFEVWREGINLVQIYTWILQSPDGKQVPIIWWFQSCKKNHTYMYIKS